MAVLSLSEMICSTAKTNICNTGNIVCYSANYRDKLEFEFNAERYSCNKNSHAEIVVYDPHFLLSYLKLFTEFSHQMLEILVPVLNL